METISGSRRQRPDYGILRIRRGQGVLPHVVPVAPPVVVDVSGQPIGQIDDVCPEVEPLEESNWEYRQMQDMVRHVKLARSDQIE